MLAGFCFGSLAIVIPAHAFSGARAFLGDSIKSPSAIRGQTITRSVLTAAERTAVLPFSVSLKMRSMDNLHARLAQSQRISQADMEANYLPACSDYEVTKNWLVSQGFKLTLNDPNHTTVFASGTVAQIETAFDGVTFARVKTADGEFTSAVTAPSIPVELADTTLAIGGLQPHLRLRSQMPKPQIVTEPSGEKLVAPSDMMAQYNAPANFNASGQTIAVIMAGTVLASDYDLYCQTIGLNQTADAYLTTIPVGGGPSSSDDNSVYNAEATLEVELASGMAPGAHIRLYSCQLGSVAIDHSAIQILADAKANNITVVSISAYVPEPYFPVAALQAYSQTLSLLAADGITVLASSGDGGSNADPNGNGGYNASSPLAALWPAIDPYVTGVGGTVMTISPPTYARVSETTWNDISTIAQATGGGVSAFFQPPLDRPVTTVILM